ncbi:TPA: NUDIX domain-containing protein [Candidatus Woesearchaeota archaeon]|nr:NUDIX domain-containing protein [Candidatus Woesearchaeota archaeon]HIH32353.1 NUDIX domain-containing protein [Candidatus Woesearchaeota archaeon]HIH54465.1 NUDIX domain-containing protein [Candidatus Woesearchaeota archaeon]HIJ01727.1 NUDIX domain-containing protein [Candidatus Woesearchaeota archaeon]HIJ14366.1 NUDIX domain-containing protein [Candidatus Woesearchaeota archaeon]
MEREKSCGAIVFYKDDELKFLVIHHHKDHGDHRDFPKGHVEKGESESETASREVFEETGVKIEIVNGFKEIVSYTMDNGIGKDVVYFLANPINLDIKIDPNGLQDAGWFTYEEALKRFTFDNARQLLKKAKAFIDKELTSN